MTIGVDNGQSALAPNRTSFERAATTGCAHSTCVTRRPKCQRLSGLLLVGIWLCIGCQRGGSKAVALPARHSISSDQLLVLSDFRLPADHALIQDLKQLRNQAAEVLDLPLDHNQVIVYLFDNERKYRKYINVTYPRLPPRRAYFVGTPSELAVYTFWGDRIQEDLRHEFTHGLLHSCHQRVPLWLDEGLAEYFEMTGPTPGRINRDYVVRLRAAMSNGWRPDIDRLERLNEFAKMQRTDYQEAWAWVHFMLHDSPELKQVLLGYLQDLRVEPHPPGLSARLKRDVPDFEQRFLSYLASLGTPLSRNTDRSSKTGGVPKVAQAARR